MLQLGHISIYMKTTSQKSFLLGETKMDPKWPEEPKYKIIMSANFPKTEIQSG